MNIKEFIKHYKICELLFDIFPIYPSDIYWIYSEFWILTSLFWTCSLHISVFQNYTFWENELACNLFPCIKRFYKGLQKKIKFLAVQEVKPNLTYCPLHIYKGFSKFIEGKKQGSLDAKIDQIDLCHIYMSYASYDIKYHI